MLKMAIPNKGALSEDAVRLLGEAGYKCSRSGRELVVSDRVNEIDFVFLRPRDIALYVGNGVLDLGITSMQSRVIYYVLVHFKEGPVLQRDIESVFGLSRSTTTGILQQLEKKDIIRREGVASDARLKSLVPTQHAVELNAQVYACLRETDRMLTRGLSGGQLQLFKETAAQMLQNLEDWDGFSDDAAAENPKQSVPS